MAAGTGWQAAHPFAGPAGVHISPMPDGVSRVSPVPGVISVEAATRSPGRVFRKHTATRDAQNHTVF